MTRKKVRTFPKSRIQSFGRHLTQEKWDIFEDGMSVDKTVEAFHYRTV